MNLYSGRRVLIPEQTCVQCGRCCEKWGWGQKGIIEVIIPWIRDNREDILQHVSLTFRGGKRRCGKEISFGNVPQITLIRYWIGIDGRALSYCPFFRRADDGKACCMIHDTKPKVCTGFTPWNEGIRDYALNCPACRNSAP